MFGLDPLIATLLLSAGLFIMGAIFGKNYLQPDVEEIIGVTIDNLAREGYLKYHYEDDQMVLEKVNGKNDDQEEETA